MARRKITTTDDLAATSKDLPELTHQQLKFVEGILAGHTASDAFRAAYDCSSMQANTIWAAASRLRADGKVVTWLDAARCAGFGRATCTYDEHMSELARLRTLAEKSGNIGAAVQAEQIRGKVAGHHVERIADVTEREDLSRTLQDIAKASPELAAALAAENGIEWATETGATKH